VLSRRRHRASSIWRLLGAFRRVPQHAAWSLVPWGKLAGSHPPARSPASLFFRVCSRTIRQQRCVLRQAGNSCLFAGVERRSIRNCLRRHGEDERSGPTRRLLAYRAIAIVSIVSWFFVIYWGRMLPFIGNAF
jgi:hypothetical protein